MLKFTILSIFASVQTNIYFYFNLYNNKLKNTHVIKLLAIFFQNYIVTKFIYINCLKLFLQKHCISFNFLSVFFAHWFYAWNVIYSDYVLFFSFFFYHSFLQILWFMLLLSLSSPSATTSTIAIATAKIIIFISINITNTRTTPTISFTVTATNNRTTKTSTTVLIPAKLSISPSHNNWK